LFEVHRFTASVESVQGDADVTASMPFCIQRFMNTAVINSSRRKAQKMATKTSRRNATKVTQ
jgi:hypothetical protein